MNTVDDKQCENNTVSTDPPMIDTQHDAPSETPSTETNDDPESVFPFRPEVFETSTPKQRLILLTARDMSISGDSTQSLIAELADCSPTYVTDALTKYVHRRDLPVAYSVAHSCIADNSYSDLTSYQRQIINMTVMQPDMTQDMMATLIGCSQSYVQTVQRRYNDVIQGQNPRRTRIDTPVAADDIPLDSLVTDRRDMDERDVVTDDVPPILLQPFSRELLRDLSVSERFVLLAARECAIRGDVSRELVKNTADTWSKAKVDHVVGRFRYKHQQYPVAAAVSEAFYPDLSYDLLEGDELAAINYMIANPNASASTVSNATPCSQNQAWRLQGMYKSVIEKRRERLAGRVEPATP